MKKPTKTRDQHKKQLACGHAQTRSLDLPLAVATERATTDLSTADAVTAPAIPIPCSPR